MKKILLIVCLLIASLGSVNASHISGEKAESVVKSTADEALSFLKGQKENWDQVAVESKFEDILDKYFNVKYIAKASLGQYWRKATDSEKQAYLKIFKDNIIKVYAVRFKEYKNQVIEVEKSSVRGRGDVIVFSKITSGEGDQPPLGVDWRVRLQKDGSYRIIDLDIAGVSMLITQKNEYKAIIEQNGGKVQALIDELISIVANN